MERFDRRLVCHILKLEYDFETLTGTIYLPDGDCCHKDGCVALFVGIDPEVLNILTYSGDALDTCYARTETGWTVSRAG